MHADYIKFKRPVMVEGVLYAGDDVVARDQLPAGSLKSLLYVGDVSPCEAPAEPAAASSFDPEPATTADPKPKAKAKK